MFWEKIAHKKLWGQNPVAGARHAAALASITDAMWTVLTQH